MEMTITMLSTGDAFTNAKPEPKLFASGLENVVAAQTRLSRVDGERGELTIAGFAVEEIASQATFEEMVYLLWHDALPNREQLAQFHATLAGARTVTAPVTEL